jgi:hypothetical protein
VAEVSEAFGLDAMVEALQEARNRATRHFSPSGSIRAASSPRCCDHDQAARPKRDLVRGRRGGPARASRGKTANGPGTAPPANKPLILSSAKFAEGFVPPDYVIFGLLQRRFLYSITGRTGAGRDPVEDRRACCRGHKDH